MADARLSSSLRTASWIGAGLYIVLATGLIARTLVYRSETQEQLRATKADGAASSELRRRIAQASESTVSAPSSGSKSSATDLQRLIDQEASRLGCAVSEFQAASESQPFLSRFEKDPKANPWTQTEVSFAIEGRFQDAFAVLATLSEQSVLLEPSSIEVIRVGNVSTDTAKVVARAQGRVLSRGDAPKP